MSYTITNFSQTVSLTIPDMPPGINTVDTSLNLIGRGYPNYGEKTAENFLYLLENFASPYPGPRNPIEGQLWYDTTDPNHKVLRVRDGINWSNASGIYQQGDDPRTSVDAPARLRAGDIWVDTANYELKIFNNSDWTLVGPMLTESAGLDIETVADNASTSTYSIVKLWSDGEIVAIISNSSFSPKSVIPGFPSLVPGINLRNTGTNVVPILNGTALSAENLKVDGTDYASSSFLRVDDPTPKDSGGQVITGRVFFKTPVTDLKGNYGVVINNQTNNGDTGFIQFYKDSNDAVILNNNPSGKILFNIENTTPISVTSTNVTVDAQLTVNKVLSLQSSTSVAGSLYVGTTATVQGSLTVNSTATIADLDLVGTLVVNSSTAILPSVSGVSNIGSPSNYFDKLFVGEIGTTATNTTVYGKVKGSATFLEYGTSFKLRGQVEANSFVFNGRTTSSFISTVERDGANLATIVTDAPHNLVTGTSITVECSDSSFDVLDTLIISATATSITYYNAGGAVGTTPATGTVYAAPATFNSKLTGAAIGDQVNADTAEDLTFLALHTSTNELRKIKLFYPGMISPFGGDKNISLPNSGAPEGWLWCDGSSYSTSTYSALYNVIGDRYGPVLLDMFKVPDFTSTAVGGYTIYYIIKT